MVNEHGILRASPCDGHISTRWNCHVGQYDKNQERETDCETESTWWMETKFLQFLLFFVREESRRITHKGTGRKRIPISIQKLPFKNEKVRFKCKSWISFSPLSTGWVHKCKRDRTGKTVSGDSLISSAITDGQEGHFKKTELLKPVRHLKQCWKSKSQWPRRTGSCLACGRPAPRCYISASMSAFQTPLLFAGCGMSRTSAPASLIENIIFSINNTSEFFISKLPGKADIFTTRSKLYVSATILGGEPPTQWP